MKRSMLVAAFFSFGVFALAVSWPSTSAGVPVDPAFTYQGQLDRAGSPFTGSCDLRFRLYDQAVAGVQQGSTQTVAGVAVANGLFTVSLNFGAQFTGDSRWLESDVQCTGDGGYTTLSPRQQLSGTPYALSLRPGASVVGSLNSVPMLTIQNSGASGSAIRASSNSFRGIDASSVSFQAVYGFSQNNAGLVGESQSFDAVLGTSHSQLNAGISGNNDAGGTGVFAASVGGGTGVRGVSDSGRGVWGSSNTFDAIYGFSGPKVGVLGESNGSDGVYGTSHSATHAGTSGHNNAGGFGVMGDTNATQTDQVAGVYGTSSGTGSIGVKGEANAAGSWGVHGKADNGVGVYAKSANGAAAFAEGNVQQSRDKGGWVKAMVHVRKFPSTAIDRCFNGVTGATSGTCGFSVTHLGQGADGIDFGFVVTDRFVLSTPDAGIYIATNAIGTNVATEIFITTFRTDTNALVDQDYYLFVF